MTQTLEPPTTQDSPTSRAQSWLTDFESALTSGDVEAAAAGAASGIVTTVVTMGSSLGLSVLGAIAAAHTNELLASDVIDRIAVSAGYQRAFWVIAIAVAMAAASVGVWLQETPDASPMP